MEKCNKSTLELRPTARIDGSGRESFPDDRLADISGDEEVDTGTETVSFLEEFIEEDYYESSNHELNDKE